MFKKVIGSPSDKYEVPEMKVEMLRAYNPQDIDDLHAKIIELLNRLKDEECEASRESITALMHIYVQAIERLLHPMPIFNFPIHPNTDDYDLLGSEKDHADSYFEGLMKAAKEKVDKKGD